MLHIQHYNHLQQFFWTSLIFCCFKYYTFTSRSYCTCTAFSHIVIQIKNRIINNQHHVMKQTNQVRDGYLSQTFANIIHYGIINKKRYDTIFVEKSQTYSSAFKTYLAESDVVENDDSKKQLVGCICLVTGASRGIGKGIALELGRQGATVYVTGTSSSKKKADKSNENNNFGITPTSMEQIVYPGTIEETATEVTCLGGRGIAVYCNHAIDANVRAVFDQISIENNGRLDILVNNAFQTPARRMEFLMKKFWEDGAEETWDTIHTVGLRSHYIASSYAMPLMFNTCNSTNSTVKAKRIIPRPLVIMISSFGGLAYTFNTAYGVGKAGLDRLAKDMSLELQESNKDIAVISLWPGLVRTEITDISIESGDWDRFVRIPRIETNFESTHFTGKAIVALALDSNNIQYTGTYQVVAELANKYQFVDINGNLPPSIRSLRFLLPTYAFNERMRTKIPSKLIPDWKIPFWIMSSGGKAPSPSTE